MFDTVAILKGNAQSAYDEYGNEIITYEERKVMTKTRSVYKNEFYSAAQAGLHPSIVFILSVREEYDGEKIIEWEGKEYNVIRVDWNADYDRVELTCEERVGDGSGVADGQASG